MFKSIILAAAISAGVMMPLARAESEGLSCATTAQPPLVRAEGMAEKLGDVVFNCTGAPSSSDTLDFTLFLTVDITNRINAQNQTDVVLSTDTGSGPTPSNVPGVLMSPISIAFSGVQVPLSAAGTVVIRISGLRGNASESAPYSPFIQVNLSVGGSSVLTLTQSTLTVGQSTTGLYASGASAIACAQSGSAGASSLSFAAFLSSHAVFDETRLTEGFAYAFATKSDPQSTDADTGTRILVQYSGAPPNAALYIPDVIAGSDATQPTSAGLHGLPVSGGQYTPGGNGSLLLARVLGADATGAGGAPVYTPGAPGSGTVSFDKLEAVPLTNGAGYAVYEVVDAADNARETALFPTFATFPPILTGQAYYIIQQVSLAPVSTITQASQTAPIPRFTGAAAPSDCPIIGDCKASPQPAISSVTSAANFTVGTVVAGSLAAVTGSNLSGHQTTITFGGAAAQILYNDQQQIYLQVPAAVTGQNGAQMFIGVDGQTVSKMVPLAPFSPAVFQGAILNQDNTPNSLTPAPLGSVVQVWGTGMTSGGVITVTLGNRVITPETWTEVKGVPGIQQVNFRVPADLELHSGAVSFSVCEASSGGSQGVCSPARTLNVTQ